MASNEIKPFSERLQTVERRLELEAEAVAEVVRLQEEEGCTANSCKKLTLLQFRSLTSKVPQGRRCASARLGSIIEDLHYGQQHKSRMVFGKLKKRLCLRHGSILV